MYLYDVQSGDFELFVKAPREPGHPVEATILTVTELDAEHLLFVVNQAVYRLRIKDRRLDKVFDLANLGYPAGWIRHLLVEQQRLFIAAFNGLIYLDLSSGEHQYLPHLPVELTMPTAAQQHTKYLLATSTQLYVGTVSGLYRIARQDIDNFLRHGTPYQVQTLLTERNIWHLRDRGDNLLAATDSGLWQLTANQSEQVLCFSQSNQQLQDNTLVDIALDNEGGFWLANRGEGVFYYHPQTDAFQSWSANTGFALSHPNVQSMTELQGDIWLATQNGLNRLNPQTAEVKQYLVNTNATPSLHQGRIQQLIAHAEKLYLQS